MDEVVIQEKVRELTDAGKIMEFIVSGNAYFTIQSNETLKRVTYRVNAAKKDRNSTKIKGNQSDSLFFVSYLAGPSNTTDFIYLGIITKNPGLKPLAKGAYNFQTTRASHPMAETPQAKGLQSLIYWLSQRGEIPPWASFYHAGRCCRCGRQLTVPASVEAGIGPECANAE